MTIFRVRQHEPKPLSWWHSQHQAGRIDMEPVFQRRSSLWSEWKKAHLIDSIVNEFDIPKFYVADFTAAKSRLNTKKVPYAIIDGKQRLEAIYAFFDGRLRLNASARLEAEEMPIGGLSYAELRTKHPALAARVEGFRPVVMSVETDSDDMIKQMFIRLNSGEAANSAERRNAMPGPIPDIIRDLTVHPFFQRKVRFNTKRMADFSLAAKLLLIESTGGFVETKASNLDGFVKGVWETISGLQERGQEARIEKVMQPYVKAEKVVLNTLERMSLIFRDRDPLLSAQGQVPVYYWLIRKHPEEADRFREFLEDFTVKVLENLRLSRIAPKKADQELSNYYTYSRTTNEQASLQARFDILLKRLRSKR